MPEFRPFDYGNVLAQGENIKGARAQNALLARQNAQAAREDALLANPDTTPEQFIRGGMTGVGNSLLNAQGDQRATAEQALGQLGQVAQELIQLDPASRRAAASRVVQSPQFAPAFQALGLDPSTLNIGALDDATLESELQQLVALSGGAGAAQGLPAELQTFQAMTQGLPTEDTERARRIALGLESRAGQLRVVDIGGVPHLAGAIDGQPFQVPMSSLQQEAGAAGTIKQAEALGSGRGQAQAQREAEAPQRLARAQQQVTSIDNVIGMVDQALTNIDFGTVGAVGALSRAVPGTQAYDLNQTLLTVKANLGFDRLQQMRETSPTGGALGQVAVQELNALQAAVASLDQAQSPAQLRSNLERVREHYSNWRDTVQLSIQREQGNAPAPQTLPPGVTEEDIQFTMQKHGLTREQVLERLNAP